MTIPRSPDGPRPEDVPPAPSLAAGPYCTDYSLTRRGLLRRAAASAGVAAGTSIFGTTVLQTTYAPAAHAAASDNVLVALSLRGGADMLSLVVPHGDVGYYKARPTIAVPASSLIKRDGMFGLHPALAPLGGMWDRKQLAAVTAVGLPVPNRSHFEAMEEIEDADPGDGIRSGWLNRTLGLTTSTSPSEGVHLGSGMLPTSLHGSQPALAIGKVDALALKGPGGADRSRALAQVWSGVPGDLGSAARSALTTSAQFAPVTRRGYTPGPGARYPDGDLGDSLKEAARLIKAGVGVRAITVDHGSWDMHAQLGRVGDSHATGMHAMAAGLAAGLAAFFTDLGSHAARVTLVTVTEFGRRVAENGSRGLDHGWGNAMFVMGAGVRGGRYYGSWPGLGRSSLVEGDLAVTTDYRSVLAEVLRARFDASTARVFPGLVPEAVGVMTS